MRITYNTPLIFQSQEDSDKILQMLKEEQLAFNFASKLHYGNGEKRKNSIVNLHAKFYYAFRKENPKIRSQIAVRGEMACLSAYKAIKVNKHIIDRPIEKNSLAIRLDKRLYSYKNRTFRFGQVKGIKYHIYPKLEELLSKYTFCDPLLFVRGDKIQIALTFNLPDPPEIIENTACGIDLGIKVAAATSEGKLFVDKKYLKDKRKLRFLKRELKSKGTKPARKHLGKISNKESNRSKNQCHLLANTLIKNTSANVLVLEDLSGIKKRTKKTEFKNLSKISQVPFRKLRDILVYKAPIYGKTVRLVNPMFTSQIDSRTGVKDGIRQGSRYTCKDGVIIHADFNAACNIKLRFNERKNHPVSGLALSPIINRQAPVNEPNVCKSLIPMRMDFGVLQAASL